MKWLIILVSIFWATPHFGYQQTHRTHRVSVGVGQMSFKGGEFTLTSSSGTTEYSIIGFKVQYLGALSSSINILPSIIYLSHTSQPGSANLRTIILNLNFDYVIKDIFFIMAGFGNFWTAIDYSGTKKNILNPSYNFGLGVRFNDKFEILYQMHLLTPQGQGSTLFTRSWIGASYVF